eukprot:4013249-Pleurochrysis_carterae.AAC.1
MTTTPVTIHTSKQYSQHSDAKEGSARGLFSYRSPESSDDSELEELPLKPRLQPAPVYFGDAQSHESDG